MAEFKEFISTLRKIRHVIEKRIFGKEYLEAVKNLKEEGMEDWILERARNSFSEAQDVLLIMNDLVRFLEDMDQGIVRFRRGKEKRKETEEKEIFF